MEKTNWKNERSTVTVGNFSILLTVINRTSRQQKFIKDMEDLNSLNNCLETIDIQRILYTIVANTHLLPKVHVTFNKIGPVLGHKAGFTIKRLNYTYDNF